MIEYEDMEQPEEVETNQDERKIEAGYMEAKYRENTNTSPRRANAGKGVERLEMKFGGKTYDTQFTTSTGEKKKHFMHDMKKLAVDMTLTQMTANKGIKNMERDRWQLFIRNIHNWNTLK